MPRPSVTGREDASPLDPALPFLGFVSDPHRLASLLAESVGPVLGSRWNPSKLEVVDVTYTPGRRATVLCSMVGSESKPVRLVVTMTAGDRGDVAVVSPPALEAHGGIDLAALGVSVEIFPDDRVLSTLTRVVSPDVMRDVLADPTCGFTDAPDEVMIDLLHYRPHRRAVLRYDTCSDGQIRPLAVGKVYRSIDEASAAWTQLTKAHRILESDVANAGSHCGSPRPLRLVADLDLVLMAFVDGASLKHLLQVQGTGGRVEEAIRDAAIALAALHRGPAGPGDRRDLTTELARVRKRVGPIARVAPVLADRTDRLLGEIETRSERLALPESCFLHGDFTPSQVLVRQGSVTLLDFDLAGAGDPAIDVANLSSKLRRRARRTGDDGFRSLGRHFRDVYRRHADVGPGFDEREVVLEGLALVRSAMRAFRHDPSAAANTGADEGDPAAFLDEAELVLD